MRIFLRISFLLILFFPASYALNGQNIKFGIQTGIGTYNMSDLRNLNEVLTQKNPLNPKITSNYPPFIYYQPTIIFEFNFINIGFLYSRQSSGSRISIKDYSGEYRFDSKINSNVFGILSEIRFNPSDKLEFKLYSELGVLQTSLKLSEFFEVNGQPNLNDNYSFKSVNYYFEPGIKLSYPIKQFCAEFNLGYFSQFGEETLSGKETLTNYDGDKIKADWSGLRCGLSVFYKIPYKN